MKNILSCCSKVHPVFEIAVAVATIISIVLVASTFKEMQVQRERDNIAIVVIQSETLQIPFDNPLIFNQIDKMDDSYRVVLTAYNVGVGAAHSIKFTLDNDPIMELLKQLENINKDIDFVRNEQWNIMRRLRTTADLPSLIVEELAPKLQTQIDDLLSSGG